MTYSLLLYFSVIFGLMHKNYYKIYLNFIPHLYMQVIKHCKAKFLTMFDNFHLFIIHLIWQSYISYKCYVFISQEHILIINLLLSWNLSGICTLLIYDALINYSVSPRVFNYVWIGEKSQAINSFSLVNAIVLIFS